MASTYSTSLKLTLPGDGDQSGIWGQTTNNNLGTLLEQAIAGVVSISMADANYILTNFNGVADEARNAVLVVGGTNSAVRDLTPPLVKKVYTIVNNTIGGYAIRIIGVSGTGVIVPNSATCLVYCDGTNFYSGLSGTVGSFLVNGTASATLFAGSGANLTALNASNVTSGTVATAHLASSGIANATTFLRGDQSWATVPTPSSVATANFTMFQDGTKLIFQFDGANIASINSTGVFIAADSIVSGDTP